MSESQATVLVVDDNPAVAKVVGAMLGQAGMRVESAASGAAALVVLAQRPVDVVVTDLRMPGMDGMALLTQMRGQWPDVPVVMMTAHGTVPIAVEAMKLGASDFVLKPFDREELLYVVKKALTTGRHAQSQAAPPASMPGMPGASGFVGGSVAMKDSLDRIGRAALGSATVLLRGESGTGKELAAREIHAKSGRHAGPFVAIHCAALPEALLESELFGYEKGAFTGAMSKKPGRVELAQGGTLFLDELGDIPMTVQVKLLRLIQEREFQRLGGTQTQKADVRFVAATHRNLEEMVARGQFREDLYFRLNVVPLWLPSLRERPEDVAPLARHFCALLGPTNGRPDAALEPGAVALLEIQPWPGNVRQLQNFVERLVVMSDHALIRAADVDRELVRNVAGPSLRPRMEASSPTGNAQAQDPNAAANAGAASGGAPVADGSLMESHRRDAETEAIRTALTRAGNNRTLAARILGVSRRTLYNKLEEHGLV